MTTSSAMCVAVAFLIFVSVTPAFSAIDYGAKCNTTTAHCGEILLDDEAQCPPDSVPRDRSVPGSPCECAPARCIQPVCRFGSTRELRRTGTNTPGDCCDVYECVQPKDKNCSNVTCPEEDVNCPTDSYRLPNHRAPGDCCSRPQGCECLPGPCPEPECVDGQHARAVQQGNQKPGTCCPLYKCVENELNDTCVLDGEIWTNGSTWWKNECEQCSCINGLSFCDEKSPQCPELPESCRVTQVPQGKCCPVCVEVEPVADNSLLLFGGCVSSAGKLYQNGEKWQEDPCTTCTCLVGAKKCLAHMCVLRCDHPRYVPDECCPLCDATSMVTIPPHCPALNCSLRCLHGFVRDHSGCYTCQCQAEECVLECPNGYLQDSHGNNLCECLALHVGPTACPALTGCQKNCSHGFRLNKVGCEICKCKECRPLMDCNKTCAHGLRTNDRGCPICKCKASAEHVPEMTTSKHIITETTCISTTDGLRRDEGEAWFDGCRQCYCYGGTEMCNLITCPVPACTHPVFNMLQDCCPHCSDIGHQEQHPMVCHSVDGVYRVEGETWSLNNCTQCLCHVGRVLCKTHHCPPTPCPMPVYQPGQCCAACPESAAIPGSEHGESCGAHRPHGAAWSEDICRSCVCVNGRVSCFTQKCPNITCSRPVLAKNQCCPVCLDPSSPKTCSVGNTTYHEGEDWHEDECTRCHCSIGQKMCTQQVCSVSCVNPVKKPGVCCPICSDVNSTSSRGDQFPSSEVAPVNPHTVWIIVVVALFVSVVVCFLWCLCCRPKQQLKLDGTSESCPNPAYDDYTHKDSCLPHQYTSHDRPYQYKFVPTCESQHINEVLKTSSIGAVEKSTFAPV